MAFTNVYIYFHSRTTLHYLFKELEIIDDNERKYLGTVLLYTRTFHNKLLTNISYFTLLSHLSWVYLTVYVINVFLKQTKIFYRSFE